MSDIINLILTVLVLVLWIVVIISAVAKKCASQKTVEAEVVDKYVRNTLSKFQGTFKQESYVIVFLADGKKYDFCVSQFSYNEYRIGDKGTLKYKGSRIINFE